MPKAIYRRILLKLSGEALGGGRKRGVDNPTLKRVARQVKKVRELGVDVGIVVGGGNIWRGAQAQKDGMDRATADYAGMLATVINAVALQGILEKEGVETRLQSALEIRQVAEPFILRRALRHLEKGRVVIFAGGTGNPYFTADTAGALRAIEINAEVMLMAKNNVDGVYDDNPRTNANARKFDRIAYMEALNLGLEVMDSTALTLCMDNKLPIIVFDLKAPDSMYRIVTGESTGTLVSGES